MNVHLNFQRGGCSNKVVKHIWLHFLGQIYVEHGLLVPDQLSLKLHLVFVNFLENDP